LKKFGLIFFTLLYFIGAIKAQNLSLAAASNVRYAISEIIEKYKVVYETEVNVVFASSGKLSAQIMNGAPYDVFISANRVYSQTLYAKGYTTQPPGGLVKGSLILWTRNSTEEGDPFSVLCNDNIKTVAMANPLNAPYGIAAMEYLNSMLKTDSLGNNYKCKKIMDKAVYLESISQVNQHIALKTVDAAFTGKSFVFSGQLPESGHWVDVDTAFYKPVMHYVVQLKNNRKMDEEAQRFIKFLYAPEAMAIFRKYGYY
jgi:molybdate transport system substrate-binding protein